MKIVKGELLKKHSYIRIGGPAKMFSYVNSYEDLQNLIETAQELGVPYYIVGEGSNILFSDKGYDGIIIKTTPFSGIEIRENIATVKAGTQLPKLVQELVSAGLSGLEQLCEIPGTVGGAVAGNAGAFGREIGEVFKCGKILTTKNEIIEVSQEDMQFSYRSSRLKTFGILLEASFKLAKSDTATIKNAIEIYKKRRRESQPIGELTLGSVFKNPTGVSAGYLLDRAGLKGYTIGGAKYSEKHANFIVNFNDATCDDINMLIDEGRSRVKAMFNIELELEIVILKDGDHFA
ncbi:MAG: UDP-N-acetylmuramate dehydrogenase [Candidatus Hydrothermia bacterium]|mgnify:FL=1|nr:UDP-N-acetylmuramate dehydrogenase [Candidatus Hydrothermae bacterium]MDD3649427.1 UDP-N-acetylmuramate dehydrogenase [Candidatus Hydrothermia bacterium]MDD5572805.1 UDP-N-acetylmuramate dehydrogenase [Candidatus Hydrothermia bacterium]HOK22855.1 UDP-N-acetylmuramate dehydrogenase [Candidatus Hydrothermia bacterium]HOL23564.1 UDP-N-acetylmuramate dehydrogenase [Candidatus Hydrothermia bacterium]